MTIQETNQVGALQRRLDIGLFAIFCALFAWFLYQHHVDHSSPRMLFLSGAMVLSSSVIFIRERSFAALLLLIASALAVIASFLLK